MTVETTTIKSKQTMTAAVVNYTFPFRALLSAPGDIKCKRTNTTTNVDEDMTRVTEIPSPSDSGDVLSYLVSINTDGVGGTITVAWPSTNSSITIYRETTDKQESDYADYNQLPAETVETDFDKRTMKSQEMAEELGRSLKFAITAATGSTLPSPEADKYLGWDSDGVLLENKTLVTDGTILVKATTAQAVAGTDDNAYMTPDKTKTALKTMGTVDITTQATVAMMDAAAITAGNMLVNTTGTITDISVTGGIAAALTVTNINISSGTIDGQVTGATQSGGDNSTKLATTAYVDAAGSGSIPAGVTVPYAADTAPTGWVLCDGSAYSRTATYDTLFAAIGTAYGDGDGSTTFNVPDMRGRYALGADNMGGSSADRVTSASADTLGLGDGTEDASSSHSHTIKYASNGAGAGTPYYSIQTRSENSGMWPSHARSDQASSWTDYEASGFRAGGAATTDGNCPPYQTFNYIIKY